MNQWHQYPFVRLIIPFAMGILIAGTMQENINTFCLINPFIAIMALFIITVFLIKPAYKYRWLPGTLLFFTLLLSGWVLSLIKTKSYFAANQYLQSRDSCSSLIINISSRLAEKKNSWKCTGNVISTDSIPSEAHKPEILIYFEKDSLIDLKMGDVVLIESRPTEIQGPRNPDEFDYRSYLAQRGIQYQVYAKAGSWHKIDSLKGNQLRLFSAKLSRYCLNVLSSNGLNKNEFGVASALIVGDKSFIDNETRQQYASAGAMHILCVSGLHVGIIYLFFAFLLRFLLKFKYGNIIQAVMLILLIWLYAMITGLSPSVMRASAMFTMLALGRTFRRNTNIFNTLAASAFILLAIDPGMLLETGFQLSYLAVTGIILVHPVIYSIWSPGNSQLDKVWSLVCVSVAAQVLTFPVSLYLFHQFPNYFILTNILVIPLAFCIVFGGMIILMFSFLPPLTSALVYLFGKMITGLNYCIELINSMPFSVTEGVFITGIQMIFIYIAIIILMFIMIRKQFRLIKVFLIVVILLNINLGIGKINRQRKIGFFVYAIRKHTAMEFVSGDSRVFMADSALLSNPSKIKFHLGNHWARLGSKNAVVSEIDTSEIRNSVFFKSDNFISFYGKTIYLVNNSHIPVLKELTKTDYVVIHGSPAINIRDVCKKTDPAMIIISADNNPWLVNDWAEECEELGFPFHNTAEQGYYEAGF